MDIGPSTAEAQLRAKLASLESGLSSTLHIGIAIGILVERHRITPDEGLDVLLKASEKQHRKASDVATDLIHYGVLQRAPILRLLPGGHHTP